MLKKGYQLQLNVLRRFESSIRFRNTYGWGAVELGRSGFKYNL